ATRTRCLEFNKIKFFDTIKTIWLHTFKPTTIQSGFKKTGLILFNPTIVLDKLVYIHKVDEETTQTPSPGPEYENYILSTPHTIHSLKRHADSLQVHINELSSTLMVSIQKYVKGSLAQTQSSALALDELENMKATELTYTFQQKRSWRSLQKWEVLYAHEAYLMVCQKEQESVEKELQNA
ncbi:hypothetical protein C7212DRAFT_171926, partial [Tuber magnatum]